MRKYYLWLFIVLFSSQARADQQLLRQIQQSDFAEKVHPQLILKLSKTAPTEKIAVWIQLRDRPKYSLRDLPAKGYLPPVNEQYISAARDLPGAVLLGISENSPMW